MPTATVARIRRCVRDNEYALAQSLSVLSARPDAKPQGSDEYTLDSFFDVTAHAQAMLNEKFGVLSANRMSEAAEAATPLRIGTDISVAPVLPHAVMVDVSRGLNKSMPIVGLSVDMQTDRNSIEATG